LLPNLWEEETETQRPSRVQFLKPTSNVETMTKKKFVKSATLTNGFLNGSQGGGAPGQQLTQSSASSSSSSGQSLGRNTAPTVSPWKPPSVQATSSSQLKGDNTTSSTARAHNNNQNVKSTPNYSRPATRPTTTTATAPIISTNPWSRQAEEGVILAPPPSPDNHIKQVPSRTKLDTEAAEFRFTPRLPTYSTGRGWGSNDPPAPPSHDDWNANAAPFLYPFTVVPSHPPPVAIDFEKEVIAICMQGRRKRGVQISPTYILTQLREKFQDRDEAITKEKLTRGSARYRHIEKLTSEILAFFAAYRACRTIATLFDFEQEICEKWNLEKFDDLGLGPLFYQDFVQQEYHPSAEIGSVTRITFMDVVKYLKEYSMKSKNRRVDSDEFLSALARYKGLIYSSDLLVTFGKNFPGCIFKLFGDVNGKMRNELDTITKGLELEIESKLKGWEDENKDKSLATPEV